MKLLHTIHPSNMHAWLWATTRTGNGRPLAGGGTAWAPIAHLYRTARGAPPRDGWARSHWQPFRGELSRDVLLNPLCGPTRSTARYVTVNFIHDYLNGSVTLCRMCALEARRQGITGSYQSTAIGYDPWTNLRRAGDTNLSDPVTGL